MHEFDFSIDRRLVNGKGVIYPICENSHFPIYAETSMLNREKKP
jgi:hypothetical protein